MLAMIGSAGLGLSWGWLVVQLGGARLPTAAAGLGLLLASVVLGAEVVVLAGWQATLGFLGAAVAGVVFHLVWLRQLLGAAKAGE